jgi:hypothetical protein
MCELKQAVSESALSVINMGNNAKIPDILHMQQK